MLEEEEKKSLRDALVHEMNKAPSFQDAITELDFHCVDAKETSESRRKALKEFFPDWSDAKCGTLCELMEHQPPPTGDQKRARITKLYRKADSDRIPYERNLRERLLEDEINFIKKQVKQGVPFRISKPAMLHLFRQDSQSDDEANVLVKVLKYTVTRDDEIRAAMADTMVSRIAKVFGRGEGEDETSSASSADPHFEETLDMILQHTDALDTFDGESIYQSLLRHYVLPSSTHGATESSRSRPKLLRDSIEKIEKRKQFVETLIKDSWWLLGYALLYLPYLFCVMTIVLCVFKQQKLRHTNDMNDPRTVGDFFRTSVVEAQKKNNNLPASACYVPTTTHLNLNAWIHQVGKSSPLHVSLREVGYWNGKTAVPHHMLNITAQPPVAAHLSSLDRSTDHHQPQVSSETWKEFCLGVNHHPHCQIGEGQVNAVFATFATDLSLVTVISHLHHMSSSSCVEVDTSNIYDFSHFKAPLMVTTVLSAVCAAARLLIVTGLNRAMETSEATFTVVRNTLLFISTMLQVATCFELHSTEATTASWFSAASFVVWLELLIALFYHVRLSHRTLHRGKRFYATTAIASLAMIGLSHIVLYYFVTFDFYEPRLGTYPLRMTRQDLHKTTVWETIRVSRMRFAALDQLLLLSTATGSGLLVAIPTGLFGKRLPPWLIAVVAIPSFSYLTPTTLNINAPFENLISSTYFAFCGDEAAPRYHFLLGGQLFFGLMVLLGVMSSWCSSIKNSGLMGREACIFLFVKPPRWCKTCFTVTKRVVLQHIFHIEHQKQHPSPLPSPRSQSPIANDEPLPLNVQLTGEVLHSLLMCEKMHELRVIASQNGVRTHIGGRDRRSKENMVDDIVWVYGTNKALKGEYFQKLKEMYKLPMKNE